MRPSTLATVVCGISILGAAVAANQIAAAGPKAGRASQEATAVRLWSASGGNVRVHWNRELARDLGITVTAIGASTDADGFGRFPLSTRSMRFRVNGGYVRGVSDGALQAKGGYELSLRGGKIALQDFKLVPRPTQRGQQPQFDLVGADGRAWFFVDRVMHELIDSDTTLTVRSSDLRISAQLAQRLGQPQVAGWTIAEVQLTAPVSVQGSGAMQLADQIRWHGEAAPGGDTYQNDLFMKNITAQYVRCQSCTGENGSGRVVVTPSSTLRNNANQGSTVATVAGDPLGTSSARYAASIPWYSKFTGNFPPYGNDQHPFLIWNMYRVNADGSIEQIGRSGVKQAFLTVNVACLDPNDHDPHVLGRGCEDTYSVSNNDNNNSLSPRWEILPATGQWGRCGSTFDTNCDGVANASPAPDTYYERLIVRESQIAPSLNAGASYLFDSWYLARQDINIYNSMSSLQVTPSWNGSVWNFAFTGHKLGTVVDRWMGPEVPRQQRQVQMIRELVDNGAHAKVAVKVSRVGNLWRYHYAVMNLDFAFATTTGAEPNLRITSTRGFDGFGVGTAATVSDTVFRDGDLDGVNNWSFAAAGGSAKWTNGASPQTTLGWGVLYSFSLTSSAAPVQGQATLYATGAPTPRTFTVATLVPGS